MSRSPDIELLSLLKTAAVVGLGQRPQQRKEVDIGDVNVLGSLPVNM